MAGKPNPMQSYQEATNQLLQINAQRRGNTKEAMMNETMEAAQNNTLAQAAGFVSSQSPQAVQAASANLNPATQNILGKYGLGQPRVQKSNSSSQQVTKQNVVINNKNTTVTNNNVHVPANIGGPIHGRPIQFQDPSQIKFKAWLSKSFAQQNELAVKRKREYEKRDSALERSSNKLMKKLAETGKVIATNLNPKNMASSMGSQFKTLMMILGFGYLAKKWPELLGSVNRIEAKVKALFDKENLSLLSESLGSALGGKKGESFFQSLKGLLLDDKDGLLGYLKVILKNRAEERSKAIGKIPKPDLAWRGLAVGENITRIAGNLFSYLGDVISAVVNPNATAVKKTKETADKEVDEYHDKNISKTTDRVTTTQKTITGEEVIGADGKPVQITASSGDYALMRSNTSSDYYGGLAEGTLDRRGNLENTARASISQGNDINTTYSNAQSGNIQTARAAQGFTRLYNSARKNGKVVLSKQTLEGFIPEDEMKSLGIKEAKGYYVMRPKTDAEYAMEYAKVTGDNTALDQLAGMLGGFLGGAIGFSTGVGPMTRTFGSIEGAKIVGKSFENYVKDARAKATIDPNTIEIITRDNIDNLPPESKIIGPVTEGLYELDENQVKQLIQKVTNYNGDEINLENSEFIEAVEKSLVDKVKPENQKNIKKDINISDVYEVDQLHKQHKEEENMFYERSRMNKVDVSTIPSALKDHWDVAMSTEPVPGGLASANASGTATTTATGSLAGDAGVGDAGTGGTQQDNEMISKYIEIARRNAQGSVYSQANRMGEKSYDCSSFVSRTVNEAGIDVNPSNDTTSMRADFTKHGFTWHDKLIGSDTSFLKPGDILLKDKGDNRHTEIYTGNGMTVGAHSTKSGVSERKHWSGYNYNGFLRLGNGGSNTATATATATNTNTGTSTSNTATASATNTKPKETEQTVAVPESATPASSTTSTANASTQSSNEQVSFEGYASLPEAEVVATALPSASTFTADSNIETEFPDVYSSGGGSESFSENKNQNTKDYTAYIDLVNTNLQTIQGLLKLDAEAAANNIEATNGVITAIGNLKASGGPSIAYAPSLTDNYYNNKA